MLPRFLRRLATWIARAALGGAWLVLFAWLIGAVVNDRFLWSQFLWWIPTPFAAAMSAALAAVAWALFRAARWGDHAAPPRRSRPMLAAAWIGAGSLALVFFLHETRSYRALLPAKTPTATPLRLLCWNMSSAPLEGVAQRLTDLNADVFLVANRPYFGSFPDLRATVGPDTSVAAAGRLTVISKYPVTAYALVPLGVKGAQTRTFRWKGGGVVTVDKGEALLVLLDTREWNGSDLCLWLLDLPSDPPISRADMMRQARAAIIGFSGPVYHHSKNAADQASTPDDALRARLLSPDYVTGDFNTPRRSWSISHHLAPGLRPAPDAAGHGWRMTFPAPTPWFAIDNTLLGQNVHCYYYGVQEMNVGGRDHLAQLTVLTP
jgi:hypothetical protein